MPNHLALVDGMSDREAHPAAALSALIVDDEPIARALLRELLAAEESVQWIRVVGEAGSGAEAVTAIESLRPDVVFLDVQMPEVDGFAVIERVGAEHMPAVIFVTAHDRYALRAFGVHALDYLLKPLDPEQVRATVRRAAGHLRRLEAGEAAERLLALLEHVRGEHEYLERIAVRSEGRVRLVPVEEVDWIEADDKHLVIHAGKVRHVVRGAISTLEGQLDPRRFRRVHRSTIVNIARIVELQPWFQRDYVLILRDGTRITTSAGYRSVVRELLGS